MPKLIKMYYNVYFETLYMPCLITTLSIEDKSFYLKP